jgi:ankyrin repeat and BTB/POZ domain-containing protein 2
MQCIFHIPFQRSARECNSSSDENRSSGHASMSDSGGGGGVLAGGVSEEKSPGDRLSAGVTQRSTRSRASSHHSRNRHRATPAKVCGRGARRYIKMRIQIDPNQLQVPWSGAGGLEDIRLAIQQLTLRSHTSTSTYSSLSAGSDLADGAVAARVARAPRLVSHSSLETVNTNVTSADEFVWVDSHNRFEITTVFKIGIEMCYNDILFQIGRTPTITVERVRFAEGSPFGKV